MTYGRMREFSPVPRSIWVLIAAGLIVTVIAAWWGVGNAEERIAASAERHLAVLGSDLTVSVAGRDVTLVGEAGSDEELARVVESVGELPGVRRVRTDVAVTPAPPAESRSPELTVVLEDGSVTFTGLVPDATISDDLVAAAEEQFVGGDVSSTIEAGDDVADAKWLARFRDTLPVLDELRTGAITASDREIVVSGEVVSSAARDRVDAILERAIGDTLSIRDELEIAVLPAPTFYAEGTGDVVTLEGVLPNQAAIDAIVEAAKRTHPAMEIVDQMTTGDRSGPIWLDTVPGLLDVVTRLESWSIDIADGRVSIAGLGANEEQLGAIGVLAGEVVGGELEVVTDIGLDTAALGESLNVLLRGVETFGPDGVELSSEARTQLDVAIAIMQANPSTVIEVQGYTDDEGDAAYNLQLSQQRAQAVVDYLVAGGVDTGRLSALGYGEDRPVASNDTEIGRTQNRRIEFVVREGDG